MTEINFTDYLLQNLGRSVIGLAIKHTLICYILFKKLRWLFEINLKNTVNWWTTKNVLSVSKTFLRNPIGLESSGVRRCLINMLPVSARNLPDLSIRPAIHCPDLYGALPPIRHIRFAFLVRCLWVCGQVE